MLASKDTLIFFFTYFRMSDVRDTTNFTTLGLVCDVRDTTNFTTLGLQTNVSPIAKKLFKHSFIRLLKSTNNIHHYISL